MQIRDKVWENSKELMLTLIWGSSLDKLSNSPKTFPQVCIRLRKHVSQFLFLKFTDDAVTYTTPKAF